MIVALTVIALSLASRNARWLLRLNPILGLLIIAAIVGPWVYLVGQREGWAHYLTIIRNETLGRSTEAAEHHWGPPGYHLLLLPVLFWPGSLLTAAAIARAWRRARAGKPTGAVVGRSGPATRSRWTFTTRPETFLLAWIIPSWLIFELIATKLPHYTMPLYPAIALLSARTVCAAAAGKFPFARSILDRIGVTVWGGIGAAGLIGSLGLFVEVGGFDFGAGGAGRPFLGLAVVILSTAIGGAVWLVLKQRALVPAHVLGGLAIVCWCWITLWWALPKCRQLWTSNALLAYINSNRWEDQSRALPIALIDYQEPSAVFLFRGRAVPVEWKDVREWLARNPNGVVVAPASRDAALLTEMNMRFGVVALNSVSGYNYSTGHEVDLRVYGLPMREIPHRPHPWSNP
jgi:4-amino-4-deoxy-L-arabinose transferase-like glycosyltransferase